MGFEKLKINTEDVLRGVCEFLQLEFLPTMMDQDSWTDHFGSKWDDSRSLTFRDDSAWLAPVGRWKRRLAPEDLYLCQWIGGKQIMAMGLSLDDSLFTQEVFDKAMEKIVSSPLLREAFKKWCDTGEGSERFPLDPLNPNNWEAEDLKHPEAFVNRN